MFLLSYVGPCRRRSAEAEVIVEGKKARVRQRSGERKTRVDESPVKEA